MSEWKKKIDNLWKHILPGKFYTAENDAAFKKLFVDNRELLKQFISDILHIPKEEIEDMTVLNPEFPPKEPVGKMVRLDISIKAGGRKINIEMQVIKDEDYGERSLFYWAELHVSGVKRGTEYIEIPQTIAVNILAFSLFDWEKYHSCFAVMETEKHMPLTDKLEIHFFELPKLSMQLKGEEQTKKPNNEELWLRMLSAKEKEEFDMLVSENNPFINQGIADILTMNSDEEFRDYMRERDKSEHDYYARMHKAMRKSMEEGEKKNQEKIIKNLRRLGYSEEEIARITDV